MKYNIKELKQWLNQNNRKKNSGDDSQPIVALQSTINPYKYMDEGGGASRVVGGTRKRGTRKRGTRKRGPRKRVKRKKKNDSNIACKSISYNNTKNYIYSQVTQSVFFYMYDDAK